MIDMIKLSRITIVTLVIFLTVAYLILTYTIVLNAASCQKKMKEEGKKWLGYRQTLSLSACLPLIIVLCSSLLLLLLLVITKG